jgi:hypothetical protein
VGDLDESGRPPRPDEESPPGRKRRRPLVPEQRPLPGVATHDEPRPTELPEPLKDRFERRPGRPGDPPGQHEMEPELPTQAEKSNNGNSGLPAAAGSRS